MNDTKHVVVVDKITKGDVSTWEKCPLWLWKQVRGIKGKQPSKASLSKMEEGKAIRENIRSKILEYLGKKQTADSEAPLSEEREDGVNLFNVAAVMKIKRAMSRIDIPALLSSMEPVAVDQILTVELPSGMKISARPNFVGYRDIDGHPYLCIYSWKTGGGLKREEDAESILYSYAAYRHFGLDVNVLFERINVLNGLRFSQVYYAEELEGLSEDLDRIALAIKRSAEADVEPEPTPGGHCGHCPYLERCHVRKGECDIERKLKIAAWAGALKKKVEGDLKEYAKEYINSMEESPDPWEPVIAEFCGKKYAIRQNVSYSWKLPKGFKKDSIVPFLIESGDIEALKKIPLEKVTDDLAKILMEKGLDLKKNQRVSISLVKGDE